MDLLNQPSSTTSNRSKIDLPLSIALSDYDRTRPLLNGTIKIHGADPSYTLDDILNFCIRPVYQEFDIAEMSFSWCLEARDRGEPVRALPIFPLRMPVLSYMYCRTEAPFKTPADLRGKRIAVESYRWTVNLWLRGICSDFYGLKPQDVSWFASCDDGAGFPIPKDVNLTLEPGSPWVQPWELLLDGKVDAVFSAGGLKKTYATHPAIRRLFADHEAEYESYYQKTKIVPITHVMVAGDELLQREPWVVAKVLEAFRAAQAMVDEAYVEPKFLSFGNPFAIEAVERQRRLVGPTTYTHGLEENRNAVETFVRYAYEQGYTKQHLDVDDVFAPI